MIKQKIKLPQKTQMSRKVLQPVPQTFNGYRSQFFADSRVMEAIQRYQQATIFGY